MSARERHADGLSGLGQGIGAAGGDRYESERTTEMEMAAAVEDIGGTAARPNVTAGLRARGSGLVVYWSIV
jgi:hypothetical protein